MKPNIIFDIGNVLIKWNPNKVYTNYFSGDLHKVQKFYEETQIFKWNEQIDAGAPFKEVIASLSNKFPHYKEPITFWETKWIEMIDGAIPETIKILNGLHTQKIPLYALSNWSTETFLPYIRYQYPFFDNFKDIVISGAEKVIKPNLKIYQILLERNKLQANTCIFIDDTANNLIPAQKLGMDTIKFESPQQLHKELFIRKVITHTYSQITENAGFCGKV